MGHRANLLVITDTTRELYYCHWCAHVLPENIFWGPEHAIDFCRIQRPVEYDDWLSAGWAEGCAVIDCPNKVLLFYGGQDLTTEIQMRRIFLKLLKAVWSDWDVRWAHEAMVDIVKYVGLDTSQLLRNSQDRAIEELWPPERKDWLEFVGTFHINKEIRIYPLVGLADEHLLSGPVLLDDCDKRQWYRSLNVGEWTKRSLLSGFHIDVHSQSVHYWMAHHSFTLAVDIKSAWDGWIVNFHEDYFETQNKLSGGALEFYMPTDESLVDDITRMLLAEHKPVDLLGIFKKVTEERDAGEVQIHPHALREDQLSLSKADRQKILNKALESV